jgi:hypothetical protein
MFYGRAGFGEGRADEILIMEGADVILAGDRLFAEKKEVDVIGVGFGEE